MQNSHEPAKWVQNSEEADDSVIYEEEWLRQSKTQWVHYRRGKQWETSNKLLHYSERIDDRTKTEMYDIDCLISFLQANLHLEIILKVNILIAMYIKIMIFQIYTLLLNL